MLTALSGYAARRVAGILTALWDISVLLSKGKQCIASPDRLGVLLFSLKVSKMRATWTKLMEAFV